jgi:hypothetical protein
MSEIDIKQKEQELMEEMILLACKRLIKPSLQASKRMNELFFQLHDLTGDKKYLL